MVVAGLFLLPLFQWGSRVDAFVIVGMFPVNFSFVGFLSALICRFLVCLCVSVFSVLIYFFVLVLYFAFGFQFV